MNNERVSVKLDEVMKFLFSTSNSVLLNLLNGVFGEEFNENEVEITVGNNEFITDTLETLRGDLFFKVRDSFKNKVNYHLEFQTKNDTTMVIRMFEYGLLKGKEEAVNSNYTKKIIFPKQKVIFIEENRNIPESLNMNIIFPEGEEFNYKVGVIKYWEYNDKRLVEEKMYPLLPLQLFSLRKKISKYYEKNDIGKLQELCIEAKELAIRIANESKYLFDENKILGEDFHKMLLAIQNLTEYLNRMYFNDERLEKEVEIMTKTLYDPLVEQRGIERGIERGLGLGKANLLVNQLGIKFKNVPSKYKEKLKECSSEILDKIGSDIFELQKIEDLDKYLN